MLKDKVRIINNLGMHARAASQFVSAASRFACNIEVTKDTNTVNGKSIMGLMMLAASKGTELTLSADGEDEIEAMQALRQLIADRFGEEQ